MTHWGPWDVVMSQAKLLVDLRVDSIYISHCIAMLQKCTIPTVATEKLSRNPIYWKSSVLLHHVLFICLQNWAEHVCVCVQTDGRYNTQHIGYRVNIKTKSLLRIYHSTYRVETICVSKHEELEQHSYSCQMFNYTSVLLHIVPVR